MLCACRCVCVSGLCCVGYKLQCVASAAAFVCLRLMAASRLAVSRCCCSGVSIEKLQGVASAAAICCLRFMAASRLAASRCLCSAVNGIAAWPHKASYLSQTHAHTHTDKSAEPGWDDHGLRRSEPQSLGTTISKRTGIGMRAGSGANKRSGT